MDEFLEDLKSGEIRVRDRWQFELKSDFYPRKSLLENLYTQEFYFFLPNSLQINQDTLPKSDFYRNLTNFIRYKTPSLTLKDLADPSCGDSPFHRIPPLLDNPSNKKRIETELKLLGNIFRSALREQVAVILRAPEPPEDAILTVCQEVIAVRQRFNELSQKMENERLTTSYVDEFISNTIDYYLTGLLFELRKDDKKLSVKADDAICHLILDEKHRISQKRTFRGTTDEILYRSGLLKKYIMDALSLPVNRASVQERYGGLIASFAAGIAMLAYVLLFIWQGSIFVINSLPFILLTVGAYILKDRLKEWLKGLSYQRAFYWFADYETEVQSPDERQILGVLKEYCTFIQPEDLTEEIKEMRNRDFHTMLETYKRPEQVIYFKRQVRMFSMNGVEKSRLYALNILLRYNIQEFLQKAGDPFHDYLSLDQTTHALVKSELPKVYHLNVILKNNFLNDDGKPNTEIKKFRLIVDKNGIRQIEHVH